MVFTIPVSKADLVIRGMEESEIKSTYLYPPPATLTYQTEMPPRYQKLQEFLMEEGD
jgi:hypothetical protein